MKIDIIDPAADSRWDQFIDRHPSSTIFHTSAWAQVIKEAYGYLPRYYVLQDETGQIQAALPTYLVKSKFTGNRLVCLPFSDCCCPLCSQESDIIELLNVIRNEVSSKMASYLEIKGWQQKTRPDQCNLTTSENYLIHLFDLQPGIEKLKNKLHHSVKRGINQAKKRGVTVRITHNETDLNDFYRLNVATRKKLGVIPQPYAFFKAIFKYIISSDLGFIAVAESEGRTLAAVVFLTFKDTIHYKFNTSDKNFLYKRPNHLIIWEILQYACDAGFKCFDFGRSTFEEEGLRAFKCKWGAEEIKAPYFYYPVAKGIAHCSEYSFRYRTMKVFSRILPEPLFKLTGSLLYKHLA